MKTKISILLFISVFMICCNEPPKKYKYVVDIKHTSNTYPVTVTEQTSNGLHHAAGGAILGGLVGYATGMPILTSTAAGGVIGAATSPGETATTYTTQRTDNYYTVIFSDSSRLDMTNHNWLSIGDSIEVD